MNSKHILLGIFVFILVVNSLFLAVLAQEKDNGIVYGGEDGDIIFLGLELEKLLNLINGILAVVLFLITLAAYRRSRGKRLAFVSVAFLLYAFRSFLFASELFIGEILLLDPFATILDFVILLTFFFGILKK